MGMYQGVNASEGIGIGTVMVAVDPDLTFEPHEVADSAAEKERYQTALSVFCEKTQAQADHMKETVGEAEAEIMSGHIVLAQDPGMTDAINAAIDGGTCAEQALMDTSTIKLRHEIKGTFIYVTHDQTEAMTLGDRIVVMKDGVVQQIATPQEVFNHPANIFVAGFIGVPQMNFFDAQLVRSGNGFTVKTEDMNVALAPETCAQLALNWDGGDVKEITAGVRPEQILLADKDEEGALQGTVEVTELMGSTEHVHVTAPDGQFVLIIPVVDLEAKGALKAGDTISFKFEKNATHLFDKVSGKNLI